MDLILALSHAEDFFLPGEKEDVLQRIQSNPEAILNSNERPFMKKIARAILSNEMWTGEQVRIYVSQLLLKQRLWMEQQLDSRLLNQKVYIDQKAEEEQCVYNLRLDRLCRRIKRRKRQSRQEQFRLQCKLREFSDDVYAMLHCYGATLDSHGTFKNYCANKYPEALSKKINPISHKVMQGSFSDPIELVSF